MKVHFLKLPPKGSLDRELVFQVPRMPYQGIPVHNMLEDEVLISLLEDFMDSTTPLKDKLSIMV